MHLTKQIQPKNFRKIREKTNYTDLNGTEVKLTDEFEVPTKYEGKDSETK